MLIEAPKFARDIISGAVENTVNYLKVAPQMHIPAILLGAPTTFIGYKIAEGSLSSREINSPLFTTIIIALTLLPVAISFEAWAAIYFQKYVRLKKAFITHGWNQRLVKGRIGTYCDRRTAMLAASDSEFQQEFETYLRGTKSQEKG